MNNTIFLDHAGRWRWLGPIIVVAVSLAGGCVFGGRDSGSEGLPALVVPDDEGMFAQVGEDLVRLDGDPEWERKTWPRRANFLGNGVFTVRDPSLAATDRPFTDVVGIRKVAWVRSEIAEDGRARPISGNQWQTAALPGLEVPLEFARGANGDLDVVHVKPVETLEPGLYSFFLDTGEATRKSRFGVEWSSADKQAYAATVCVDRLTGSGGAYQPCHTSTGAAAPGTPLKIVLDKPSVDSATGSRTMVVSGVVMNESGSPREVPPLSGELRGTDGSVLARWQFRAALSRLEPGQSTSFRSELRDVPRNIKNVNVDFDIAHASNQEN